MSDAPDAGRTPPPDPGGNRSSKVLLFIILGIIVATFLMFLIFRPRSADGAVPRSMPAHPATSHRLTKGAESRAK